MILLFKTSGLDKDFYEYSKPLPSEIKNIPMSDLKAVISNDGNSVFFISRRRAVV
jgi:hypothetical protein